MTTQPRHGAVQLVDMVFPGDANHHGTLFGGTALAHMDKVAFIAASRYGRASFVTASCERVDFSARSSGGDRRGDGMDRSGGAHLRQRRNRTGRRSLAKRRAAAVHARPIHHGGPEGGWAGATLPPLPELDDLQLTSRYKAVCVWWRWSFLRKPITTAVYGGDALGMMGKAAFIASTRHARAVMVMAASQRVDFRSPIGNGEMIELITNVTRTGRTSWWWRWSFGLKDSQSAERRHAASAEFVMVAVDPDGRPQMIEQG